MTTSPAIPALRSEEPWLSNDHWKPGDKAWWISLTGDGVSRTMVDIVDPAEGTVRDPRVTYNDGVFRLADRFESVRHREGSCTSCAKSVLELLAVGQDDSLGLKVLDNFQAAPQRARPIEAGDGAPQGLA